MRATILFRPNRHYRADLFATGLARHGHQVDRRPNWHPEPPDLLVIWNRTRQYETLASTYERAGARVIVAENGYLDHLDGEKHFALALGRHNGAGRWFVGGEPRFRIDEQPWRSGGEHVLVLPQRGIGQPGVAMPLGWPRLIRDRLATLTKRPIVVRRHPGLHGLRSSLEDALARARCVVTWGSGAAIKAIRAGVPCFHEMADWIGGCASMRLADQIERCDMPSRGELWRRITWAQWTMAEIESGEAFDRLIHAEGDHLFCARKPPVVDDREGDGHGDQGVRRAAGSPAVHEL